MIEQSLNNPLYRLTFDAQELVASYPPHFHHANKVILNNLANPPGSSHRGQLVCTRWKALPLPPTVHTADFRTTLEIRKGFYRYMPSAKDLSAVEWYVNFAHHDLFCSYGLGVFAQDEIQVAEHPALASLREALLSTKTKALTVENGIPTPVLIKGVARRCSIATDRNAEAGRPFGLYGRQFALATPESIERAATVLDPPTVTNIIAMEAPSYGKGTYSREQLEYILTTAFTAFSAANSESRLGSDGQPAVIVHTGFWGCGAYGGNRIVMALLQLLAANLSRVDRLVFYVPDGAGSTALETARQILEEDLMQGNSADKGIFRLFKSLFTPFKTSAASHGSLPMSQVVWRIQAKELQWGTSDGN